MLGSNLPLVATKKALFCIRTKQCFFLYFIIIMATQNRHYYRTATFCQSPKMIFTVITYILSIFYIQKELAYF